MLKATPGVTEVLQEQQIDVPQIFVEENLPVAQRYGLKPGDVRRAAATLIAGGGRGHLPAGQGLRHPGLEPRPDRDNLQAIRNLPIDTPSASR